MFTKNTYLVPQASASLHPRASCTTVDHSGFDEFLLHHHHYPDMYTGHYLGGNAAVVDHDDLFNQEFLGLNGDPDDSLENAPQVQQPMAKKDRHSKIFTAQGPRDRRVRLSKGIARKFFDLQEMLGFDKPSKTLDWLLTKSRTAISELLQTKQKGSSSSLSECDQVLSSAGNGDSCFENGNCCSEDSRQRFVHGAKDSEQQTDSSKLAKESRAKARERARARTREKMCIKQLNESRENIQFGNNNQFEVFQLSAGSCSFKENAGIGAPGANRPVVNVTATEDLIPEPVERSTYHRQSLGGSRDSMIVSNYNAGPSVNATENWDIWNQSYLYAVWDQHKFINSSSCNM